MEQLKYVLDGTNEQSKEVDAHFMKQYGITEKDIEDFDLEAYLEE